ncbi:RNA polymerase sigma factor [Phytohabitans houttuyneae]|uniref:RNA polymerase sigma factor n=1 Tax=Phytohabitans houttuyneae TaxID=1076126 RepID=UPI0031EBA183
MKDHGFAREGTPVSLQDSERGFEPMVLSPEGFDEFFRRALARLVLFLIKIGASREEAEDSAQEAMAKAYENWHAVEHPEAWVRVVAERIHLASTARARAAPARAAAGGWAGDLVRPDPDLAVFGDEQRRVLDLLRRLPHEQRRVMAWYYDGFTITEIAAIIGRPEATVRSHLRHARQRLKRELDIKDAVTPDAVGAGEGMH